MMNRTDLYSKTVTVVLILIFLSASGCATYREQKKSDALDRTTDSYETAIRWGYFEMTRNFRKDPDRQEESSLSRVRNIKITSYEVLDRKISADKSEARQTVELKYFNVEYLIEKTVVDNQLWKYDEKEQRWYLASPFPRFE